MSDKPHILIVEDEPLIAADIEEVCLDNGYFVSGTAYNMEQAMTFLEGKKVDYVLLDIRLGDADKGLVIGKILSEDYFIPFSYITSFDDAKTIQAARATRPVGYLIKPFRAQDIKVQIELGMDIHGRIASGNFPSLSRINKLLSTALSEREYDILQKIYKGKSNLEIAEDTFISMNTVKSHLKNIFVKFDVKSRAELINKLIEL
jgi:DNA-binding NarL/FixJ family response regulator